MSFISSIRRLADATPSDRNRVIDLLRAASILVVVFGHWLMAAVTVENGELVPGHLLILADWTHPLTWVFQVMPVFFLVGGYANGLSLRSARRRGQGYGGWLRARLRRLALPVVPLLLFWTAGGWIGLRLGLDWEVLQLASQVALVPTWFLAAYVLIVTIAPISMWIWERWSWWSIVVGLALAGLCDYLSISLDLVPVGFLNYLLVWGTVHQIGYAWLDGTIDELWKRALMAGVGLVGTLLLVGLGPYPVAMVGLDTSEITNSYPPRVTLAFLGMFQSGLALMLEKPLRRLMERRGAWVWVVGVSARIMTLYLW
ncbi:MAG TPA: acyltransferase family protein, partial [Acidimicrobiia bacterium]|nr:acyltransferase family protein [Acidimicrobiia bacterium]